MTQTKIKAAFIDRDGTMNKDVGYLGRLEDLHVFPFTAEAVKLLKDAGYLAIVITNQSGIGRGFYHETDLHTINGQIQDEVGVKIDGFYFCPHVPEEGCACRKPNLGMLEAAQKDFPIDMENSWMIGDKVIDIQTGINARLKTAMVMTGYGQNDLQKLDSQPDVVADDLLEAVKKILAV